MDSKNKGNAVYIGSHINYDDYQEPTTIYDVIYKGSTKIDKIFVNHELGRYQCVGKSDGYDIVGIANDDKETNNKNI